MLAPAHGKFRVTRREFLKESAALAAAIAATHSARGATNQTADSQSQSLLYLPPLLSCPTETSIRISALNDKRTAEAVIELRKDGLQEWERPQPALKLSAYEILNWTLKDLSPATRYEYRVLLKQVSDESPRPAATGSFRTQRKGPASYTAILMTDPHTGSFPAGSGPVLTLDKVVQNASGAK